MTCSAPTQARWGAAALVAALLVTAAPPAPAATTGKKPAFTTWDETFVDESRPTPAGAASPGAPSRTLVTTIYRPRGKGPFPVIVFSHGLDGHPQKFEEIFAVWAAAGFVVVAPTFPSTNSYVDDAGANASDVAQQPADVSFVLDHVLALADDRTSDLFRSIDDERIGAAGLSLGGATTYAVAFGDCCRDDRFISAAVLDGFPAAIGGEIRLDGHIPLLIAHSDTDPALPYGIAVDAFASAVAPTWFVTLHGASHATQWEDDITSYDDLAEQITLDWWNATLKGKTKAFTRLEEDASVPDLSSIEVKR